MECVRPDRSVRQTHTGQYLLLWKRGGFKNDRMMVSILQTVCLPTVKKTFQRCHSDVHRIDTIILPDINFIETHPFHNSR
jgi:hypothetical protein